MAVKNSLPVMSPGARRTGVSLRGRRVLVLGLGESGLSMVRFAHRQGAAYLRVADTRAVPPGLDRLSGLLPGLEVHTGPFTARGFEGIDLIAISPGVAKSHPLIEAARRRGVTLAGDIELFVGALPALGRPRLVAITGTNGKSTVTALTGALLRAAGMDAEVAGNIGPAALEALMHREDAGRQPEAWVLELSSFQLETVGRLDADAAAMLNLSEDHLDRYEDMAGYAAAKAQIFEGQGVQVLNRNDPASMAMRRPGREVRTFGIDPPPGPADYGLIRRGGRTLLARGSTVLCAADELKLAGEHNLANALAALALAGVLGAADEALIGGLRAFSGLPHRVQPVAELGGVTYYDDSKGTNVGSTVAALRGLGKPLAARGGRIVLIAGGDGKGQAFEPLNEAVRETVRAVVLIGRDAPRIEAALRGSGVALCHAADMKQAVDLAAAAARPGDAVLLSPACASFDMFRDYAHRAQVFIDVLHARGH